MFIVVVEAPGIGDDRNPDIQVLLGKPFPSFSQTSSVPVTVVADNLARSRSG